MGAARAGTRSRGVSGGAAFKDNFWRPMLIAAGMSILLSWRRTAAAHGAGPA